jgi:hypothetical protein
MLKKIFTIGLCTFWASQLYAMEAPENLVNEIAGLYKKQNLDIKDAFFQLDHPQWTSSDVPEDQLRKLHNWFLEGNSIQIPSSGVLSEEEQALALKKMRLLYSAGCCGHVLAAEEAGRMLLDARYNGVIPSVITYADLEPDVESMDIRRLHRSTIENEELRATIDSLNENFGEDGDLDEKERNRRALGRFQTALQKLEDIAETEEVKVIKLALKPMIRHMQEGRNPGDFMPTEAISYAKTHNINTPLVQEILNDQAMRTDPTIDKLGVYKANFLNALNVDLLDDYCRALEATTYDLVPSELSQNGIPRYKTTAEARETLRSVIQLKRAQYLLGSEDTFYITSLTSCYDVQSNEFQQAWETIKPQEDRINTFMFYLLLTRNPTVKGFNNLKMTLEIILAPLNKGRFESLQERFSQLNG